MLYLSDKPEVSSNITAYRQYFSASDKIGRLTVSGGRNILSAQNILSPGYIKDSFSLPSTSAGIAWRLEHDRIKVKASLRNNSGAGGGEITLPEDYLSGDTQADKYFFSLIDKAMGRSIPLSANYNRTAAEIAARYSPIPFFDLSAGAEFSDGRTNGGYSYVNSFTDDDFPQGSLYQGVKLSRLSLYSRQLKTSAGMGINIGGVRIGFTAGKNILETGAASVLINPAKSGVTLDILNNISAKGALENLFGTVSLASGGVSIKFKYSDNLCSGNFIIKTPVMGKEFAFFLVPIVHGFSGTVDGRLYAGALSVRYADKLSKKLAVDIFNELWRLDFFYSGSVKYSLYKIPQAALNSEGRLTEFVNRLLLRAEYSLTEKLSVNLVFQQYIPFSLEKEPAQPSAGPPPEPGVVREQKYEYGGGFISAGIGYGF